MIRSVDYYVLLGCLFMFVWWMGYEYGRMVQPKVCAQVIGMTPVSSNADNCTYVETYGRSHWKRLAIEEGKKNGIENKVR